jgi:hypothetical protein
MELADLKDLAEYMTEAEKAEMDMLLSSGLPAWIPLPGPQTEALDSKADIIFYGGAAGGGKTDLLIGLATTKHHQSVIYRREGTQHKAIIRRICDMVDGGRDRYNGQDKVFSLNDGRTIDLGSCPHLGDEEKHQGQPHDLIGFDEITHFLESQFRFLIGWLRTVKRDIRCRVVCTGNPPTDSDGQWVIRFWAAWLDNTHPNPAKPGELRWYATIDGEETEVPSGDVIDHDGELIKPMSRTFIPSKVTDNLYLMDTGYKAQLQSLPEPLRSQMLNGDFMAGIGSDPFQVIPTAWVDLAQSRWTPDGKTGQQDALGVDIARGGSDQTIISPRYGTWFDQLKEYPGSDTPNGPVVAGLVVSELRDDAPVQLDIIGVGGSVFDHLEGIGIHVVGINGADKSFEADRTKRLRFRNKRAEIWWKLRELLDPEYGEYVCLPPCPKLKADLCAPKWKLTPGGILIESKDEIKKRIGRSPDRGDAIAYATVSTEKRDSEDYDDWYEQSKQGHNGTTGY